MKTLADDIARFKGFVKLNKDCWEWTGNLSNGYPRFYFNGKLTYAHRTAWVLFKLKDPPKGKLIIRSCGNNKCVYWRHLQAITIQQHRAMRRISKKARTSLKGVSFESYSNKYKAVIQKNGGSFFLGRFKDIVDAAKAYNEAAKRLFKKFARLNVI